MAAIMLLSLVVGNFLWQALGQRDWERAVERSYFQAVAVLVVVLVR